MAKKISKQPAEREGETMEKVKGKREEVRGEGRAKCDFIDCYGRDVRPGKNDPSKLTLVHVDITCKPGCGTLGMKFGRFHRNDLKGSPIARMLRELADWAEKQEYGIDDNVQEINVYL